ncbi:hypothetical protein L211DRAFT_833759 [Terfezia boudieri ATCC MYA-4762]|uniref:Uncharacterized protein n=1 Tax=Terfezia boudieri ATCC MYA-4762 TaxID=1051890 RepID=A0A3N4M1M3_9PEZI|nr:hypothetical protein L211DRAFT_833759 [Terfezia boudieri ATCC MYA-4762]
MPEPPSYHPEGGQTFPVFELRGAQYQAGELVDIEFRLRWIQQLLPVMDKKLTNALQNVCLSNSDESFEEVLASTNKEINDKLQTVLVKLDDISRGQKQDGGAREGKVGVEKDGTPAMELKEKDLTATLRGVPVLGLIIGLWAPIVAHFLYTKEWLPRRERCWRLQDEQRKKGDKLKAVQVENVG